MPKKWHFIICFWTLSQEYLLKLAQKRGGSLQLISKMSEYVYCLDIDEVVSSLKNTFKNSTFIIGDSKITLPKILADLQEQGKEPDFILVDGDHSSEGVKNDIVNILKCNFKKPVTILMHDSFNPDCRNGMSNIDYHLYPNVKLVDLNFIRGTYSPTSITLNEMWGGFGLIQIDSIQNNNKSTSIIMEDYSYQQLYKNSKHFYLNQNDFKSRIKYFIFRKLFLKND
jgi:hypothetical protein